MWQAFDGAFLLKKEDIMTDQLMRKDSSQDLFRQLLSYIIPGIAGLIFNSLYIVVDGLFVARMLGP